MKNQEYIPSLQDLKDFEEFSKDVRMLNKQKKWQFTYRGRTREMLRETICTIIADLLANVFPKETIESVPLVDRLTFLTLFGYDIKSMAKIICCDLSDDELNMLLEGKDYPYLTAQLRAVVGNNNLDYVRSLYNQTLGTGVLPHKQFSDESWSASDTEKLQVRLELISTHYPEGRPLWCSRVFTLLNMGVDSDIVRTGKTAEVDCVEFLTHLFGDFKMHLAAYRAQFGILAKYKSKENTMIFHVAKAFLPLVECYFNVKFKNIPKSTNAKGQRAFFVEVKNWESEDE